MTTHGVSESLARLCNMRFRCLECGADELGRDLHIQTLADYDDAGNPVFTCKCGGTLKRVD